MLKLRIKFTNEDGTKFCEFVINDFIVPHIGEKILIDASNVRIEGIVDYVKHNINIPCSRHEIFIVVNENGGD